MKRPSAQFVRFLINGVLATAVHYLALRLGVEVLKLGSAGLANLLAAPLGIATSFLGNRYFVFQRQGGDLLQQALRFIGLYSAIALLHGSLLYVWSDLLKFNYHIGFLIAVAIQVVLGYLAGKHLVFKATPVHSPSRDLHGV